MRDGLMGRQIEDEDDYVESLEKRKCLINNASNRLTVNQVDYFERKISEQAGVGINSQLLLHFFSGNA